MAKVRNTFTLSKEVKEQFRKYCKQNKLSQSFQVESMMRKMMKEGVKYIADTRIEMEFIKSDKSSAKE